MAFSSTIISGVSLSLTTLLGSAQNWQNLDAWSFSAGRLGRSTRVRIADTFTSEILFVCWVSLFAENPVH